MMKHIMAPGCRHPARHVKVDEDDYLVQSGASKSLEAAREDIVGDSDTTKPVPFGGYAMWDQEEPGLDFESGVGD